VVNAAAAQPLDSEALRSAATIETVSRTVKPGRDQLGHVLRRVEVYKQAVLLAAFRGELVLQDPKNEPARARKKPA